MKLQHGQTLIETMVALFIMVMGITAALGLATYSFNASTSIRKQIIGMGLAREGVEAVKNMRDTNWLNAQLDSNCYNFADGSSTASCYRDWLNPTSGAGYNVPTGNLYIYFNATANANVPNSYWTYGTAAGNAWGLNTSSDINFGLYTPSLSNASSSGFYRQLVITQDTATPFDKPTAANSDWPRLTVKSRVWWTDKACPVSVSWPGLGKCSIELQTYLTNWKTY